MSQQTKVTNFIIREDLANAILRYLSTRPVAEAGDMFYALRNIQPAKEEPALLAEVNEENNEGVVNG